MSKLKQIAAAAVMLAASLVGADAQVFQNVQSALLHTTPHDFQRGPNWQSGNGVPLSATAGTPAGSDGRASALPPSPTPGQFQGIVTFAAMTVSAVPENLNEGAAFAANVQAIDHPRSEDGGMVRLILRAQAGASWVAQDVSLLFGSVIKPPETDVDGQLFTGAITPATYWASEPYSANNHQGEAYYYSPHAKKVFAIQAGDVRVVWRRNDPLSGRPGDFEGNEGVKYAFLDGLYYQVLASQQVASEGAVKLTRKLYWTESIFAATGIRVGVPAGVIKDLKFGYNSVFPQYVAANDVFVPDGVSTPGGDLPRLLDTRTVWWENGFINAFNKEGRLFVELLGNTMAGGTREHLGFELIDVTREAQVQDVTVELGERMPAFPDNSPSDSNLRPSPIVSLAGPSYVYQRFIGADGYSELYATRTTPELNSSQAHWLEQGIGGLWWPARFVRYRQIWPAAESKYSHYVRPAAIDDTQAATTAVTVPVENAPTIEFEDATDKIRSKFTPDVKFYTILDDNVPALRTLLRYTSGDRIAFERVFSWLDSSLRNNDFGGSVATELTAWNPGSGQLNFSNPSSAPRYVNATAYVGQRLSAPAGEASLITIAPDGEPSTNATPVYLAGYVRTNVGTAFSTTAYKNPFEVGFYEASSGSIIPVNAGNNNAHLEVWWYRPNQTDEANGFQKTLWPSTIVNYTLQWPTQAPYTRDIVLASNAGSEALSSVESRGGLYFQNDPSLPGFNPNEEHALFQGGQVWALRDDLNITNEVGYSSHPYVLLEYTDVDNRPSMTAFRVLREKANVLFDYTREAGSILQAPMPLPLLERPLGRKVIGTPPRSLNAEVRYETIEGGTRIDDGGISHIALETVSRHFFAIYELLAIQNKTGELNTRWFYVTNSNGAERELAGVLSTRKPISLGIWTASAQPADLSRFRFDVSSLSAFELGQGLMVVHPEWKTNWLVEVVDLGTVDEQHFVELQFAEAAPAEAQTGAMAIVAENSVNPNELAGTRLAWEPLPAVITNMEARDRFAKFTYQDRKGDTWFYRGPHEASSNGKLVMQFYYKTLEGFYFPSLPFNAQPPVGIITPYLRTRKADGTFIGDAVSGDLDSDNVGDGNSLGIVYRPIWPENTPVLMMAESLTMPKRGLPAIRGQSSLNLLYQQPQARQGLSAEAVVLHDPTREKQFTLGKNSPSVLSKVPDSIRTSSYQGLTYFPNLPPHLVERFFFDPNRGDNGALVLRGQFKDEVVGDDYLLLNVLGPQDILTLRGLCIGSDPNKSKWDAAINSGLATTMEKFVEDNGRPGTFKPTTWRTVGPTELAEADHQDIAVDSYALTATGPGTGYVTIVAGDGFAFTPPAEPVSMYVVKVVDALYPGQLKVVAPSNPLSEMLTLQQVVDLAGRINDYQFEWMIAAPVQGVPPPVYENSRVLLLGEGTWSHVRHAVPGDHPATIHFASPGRVIDEVTTQVTPRTLVSFATVSTNDNKLNFVLTPGQRHPLSAGATLVVRDAAGTEYNATVAAVSETTYQFQPATNLLVALNAVDPDDGELPPSIEVLQLYESGGADRPQSIVFRDFTVGEDAAFSQFFLSMDLDPTLVAKVYLDGQLVVTANADENNTEEAIAPGSFSPLSKVYQLASALFSGGSSSDGQVTHRIAVEFFSGAQPDAAFDFNLRLEAYESVDLTDQPGTQWLALDSTKFRDKVRAIIGTGADVRALSDNYLISRYRATNTTHASYHRGFSRWTEPQLAEGWVKRVLAGINPFNQRVTDLFNNSVNTDASILIQAGKRWEGDVALNLESINNYGLIEIYETVLRRGRGLSIDAGINYGPANDALLLAAGYLNDLYMMLGNEAWADASNPTIGVGTKENDVATALFAFRGQVPTLLEEELALLRGRDDILQPGVQARPVYNRMFWNYTRGIDAGEVIYALNYNIKPLPGSSAVDAAAAAHLYPQGHGDAYGHYLTATKQFTELFISRSFDWIPHAEAVTVLGQPVAVNYQHERKFAAAASSLARAGSQVVDLTWRRDYVPGGDSGWESLEVSAENNSRQVPTTRYWGVDPWASRSMQGAYYNWVIVNSILPAEDPDPTHEGIQKVDRTTVPELLELPDVAAAIQLSLENAEAHATPLGLSAGSLAFDVNPNQVVGTANSQTHFEQVYERARRALNNAVVSFDDAKDVTRQMRSELDTLAELQAAIVRQEQSYTNQLIELFGTPYPEDIGPGKTYDTGYTGPDIYHFAYVDRPEFAFSSVLEPKKSFDYEIDFSRRVKAVSAENAISTVVKLIAKLAFKFDAEPLVIKSRIKTVKFTLDSDGFFAKPTSWRGQRSSPGQLQSAVAKVAMARNALGAALDANEAQSAILDQLVDRAINRNKIQAFEASFTKTQSAKELFNKYRDARKALSKKVAETTKKTAEKMADAAATAPPTSLIAGLAAGGDATSGIRSGVKVGSATATAVKEGVENAADTIAELEKVRDFAYSNFVTVAIIQPGKKAMENQPLMDDIKNATKKLDATLYEINKRVMELDEAINGFRSIVARGDRILSEREIFRRRSATVIQGYRTRDAAFRIFRDEKLERFKTLFELAAKYTYLAANAYDYETGLLNTEKGKRFVNRIINSRALGIVKAGEPQYAGSNNGDPGLSSVLAEMRADWDVLRGRLGFNNPTPYGTTVSLRSENFRIVNGAEGDISWRDILNASRKANLLNDPDVARYCMQIDPGNGLPVPGIVVEFGTTVTDSLNLFGRQLAGGDHYFDSSYFATKIFSVGIAFEGYKGMDVPSANSGAVSTSGGSSPSEPTVSFLDPQALAATPGIYLIPVGVDSMRTPPLGDESTVRTYAVSDITIPLPFNIGGSEFSTKPQYTSGDSLTEPLFGLRKHAAFRPVANASLFSANLSPSQYTNTRLIGRSVWNSRWKLVIPGYKLLHDPNEGLDRFAHTVKDIKLHLVTYSYSGN